MTTRACSLLYKGQEAEVNNSASENLAEFTREQLKSQVFPFICLERI